VKKWCVLLLLIILLIPSIGICDDTRWMPSCLIWVSGINQTAEYAEEASRFDMILFSRLNFGEWDDYCGATRCIYDDIKTHNPDIKILTYILGGSIYSTHDAYVTRSLNDLGRWDISRGHSMGAVHLDNDATMILHSGGLDLNVPGSTVKFLLNPLNTGGYFNEAIEADLFDDEDGFDGDCDGVFFDNVRSYDVVSDEFATRDDYGAAWGTWFDAVVPYWENKGKEVCTNSGTARELYGRSMWDAWWANGNRLPDYVLDEYTVVTQYGDGDIQFYTSTYTIPALPYWRDMASKTHLVFGNGIGSYWDNNDTGLDNYGRVVNKEWVEQYAFGMYCLVRNNDISTYFALFTEASGGQTWDDIYSEANTGAFRLGDAIGDYYVKTVDGTDLYMRDFENGYVVVNLSSTDVSNISISDDLGIAAQVKEVSLSNSTKGWKSDIEKMRHHTAVILRRFEVPPTNSSGVVTSGSEIILGGNS